MEYAIAYYKAAPAIYRYDCHKNPAAGWKVLLLHDRCATTRMLLVLDTYLPVILDNLVIK